MGVVNAMGGAQCSSL